MRLRDNNNRKEVNDERIKEQLVKVQKGSEWVSTPKRNQKHLIITITDSSKHKRNQINTEWV